MKKTEDTSTTVFRFGYLLLGVQAAIGLLGYGLSYLIVMPKITHNAQE